MNMQGVSWKGKYYVFPYELNTPSEPLPDYREVMICQMSDHIETLEEQISELKKYFTSGNSIPVERATILAKDFWLIIGQVPE